MKGLYITLFAILLTGCKKNDYADLRLMLLESTINLSQTGTANDSLFEKKDVLIPNSNYAAGFAYSSLARLPNGTWLLGAVSHKKSFDDFDEAEIISISSTDGGSNWSDSNVIQENIGRINITSPNFVLLPNGEILFAFLAKNSKSSIDLFCRTASSDLRWRGVKMINKNNDGYNLTNNGRMILTRSGRIIIPMAFARDIDRDYDSQIIFCYISDDYGATWKKTKTISSSVSLMEPGITELDNGELLMCIRSSTGRVLFSRSTDNGETWSRILKSQINTPESPQTVCYSAKYKCLFMVWNNNSYDPAVFHKRSPLTLAVSFDKGNSWIKKMDLEKDPDANFFYPTLNVYNDSLYITYSKHKKGNARPSVTFGKISIDKLVK